MPRKTRKRKNKQAARRAKAAERQTSRAAEAELAGLNETLMSLRDLDLTVRSYRVEPETADEESRSVEGVLTTEAPATVFDLQNWELIDEVLLMSGLKIAPQIPFLDTHDRSTVSKQLGSARELRVEKDKLLGRAHFSEVEEDAWTKVREGHVTDFSVGYRITGFVTIEAGTSAKVEGKKYTAGERNLRVVTEWECKEVSLCPIGADSFAKVRAQQQAPGRGQDAGKERKRSMPKDEKFEKWLEGHDFDPEELSEKQEEFLRSQFEAEQALAGAEVKVTDNPPPAEPAKTAPDQAAGQSQPDPVQAERARVKAIEEMARGIPGLDQETVKRCTEGEISLDKAREIFLDKIRDRQAKPAGNPQPEGGEQALEQFDAEIFARAFGTLPGPQ